MTFSLHTRWPIWLSAIAVSSIASAAPPQQTSGPEAIAATPTRFTPVSFVEIPRLSKPSLSPDGSKILFVRSRTDWAHNRQIDEYAVIDVASHAVTLIPYEPGNDRSLSQGAWAPDGSGFAFQAKMKGDGHAQLYYYDLAKGRVQLLSKHATAASDIKWSEDGQQIYFRARRKNAVPKAMRPWQINPYDVEEPYELWRLDRQTGRNERIYAGDASVTAYDLSRDGKQILLDLLPGGQQADSHQSELWSFDITTKKVQQLTHDTYNETRAQLSPDGRRFAFVATVNGAGEDYYEDNLFVQDSGSDRPRLMMPDVPMEVLDFAWSKDGADIFVLGNIGIRTELFRLNVANGKLDRLTTGDHAIADWRYDAKAGRHVAIIEDAANPGEVFERSSADTPFRQVTSEYAGLGTKYLLPQQTAFEWKGRDGQPLEGLLIYPIGYRPGAKFPLVTIAHGGPRSSAQFGSWNMSRYVPVLAAQGYGVFLPNYRGSTGYGDAFERDMVGHYFNHAQFDVLDGIDALVAKGLADPDKLVMMGWSAGGHMTNKLITITDRFKAASSGGGVSDWVSLYGESDERYYRGAWFGGAPWQKDAPLANFESQSILKDAWRVKTPTLFFNGANDVRVPPTQEIMMYRGVLAAGAPTYLYLAKDEPHNFQKPIDQLFKINAELGWFAKYALSRAYAPDIPHVELADPDKEPVTANEGSDP